MRHALIIDCSKGHLVLFQGKMFQTDLYDKCLSAWEKGIFPASVFTHGLDKKDIVMARTKEDQTELDLAGIALTQLIKAEIDSASAREQLSDLREPILKVINGIALDEDDLELFKADADWKKKITTVVSAASGISALREELEPFKDLILGIFDLTGEEPVYTPLSIPPTTFTANKEKEKVVVTA